MSLDDKARETARAVFNDLENNVLTHEDAILSFVKAGIIYEYYKRSKDYEKQFKYMRGALKIGINEYHRRRMDTELERDLFTRYGK